MKTKRNKTLMIVALVSIFACGCPGGFLFYAGFRQISQAVGVVNSFEEFLLDIVTGLADGGWLVCPSIVIILIPFFLLLLAVLKKEKKDELEELAPTGVSQDDPLPPPS